MNGHFSLGDIHPIKYFYAIAIGLGLVFYTISQAEGAHPFWSFIQWQLQAIIPITLLIISHLFWAQFSFFQKQGHWPRLIISGVTGTILSTPFALLIEILVANEPWPSSWLLSLFEEWGGLSVPVLLSWLLMNAPLLAGYEYRKQAAGDELSISDDSSSKDKSEGTITEVQKLSGIDHLTDVLAMSSELHYLDIILMNGHQLILYSLATAVESMPEDLGMQVHRSHWVAFSAIKELKRTGRQGVIVLTNDREIPVSRNYLRAVKERISTNVQARSGA